MKIVRHSKDGRRDDRSPSLNRAWQFSLLFLFVLTTICAVLLSFFSVLRSFPLQTLIMTTLIIVTVIGLVFFIGELVLIGWVVDFLSVLGRPKSKAQPIPLEYEQVGDMIVVTLRDNICTAKQCQAVQKQLKCLVDEQHCDFVLDFFHAGRISRNFRGVMVQLMKAARREAERRSTVALHEGDAFGVFDDRQSAVQEMSRRGEHGWVVLCSVPVGTRAVFG